MRRNLLFYFVLSVVAGIIAQRFLSFPSSVLLLSLAVGIFAFAILGTVYGKRGKALIILAFLNSMLIGALILALSHVYIVNYPFGAERIKNVVLKGSVSDVFLIRKNKLQFVVKSDSIVYDKRRISFRGKFLVNVFDEPASLNALYSEIKIGDSLEILGTIRKPRRALNPGEFDYAEYLFEKNINSLFYCYDAFLVNLYEGGNGGIANWIFEIRKSLDEKIRKINDSRTAGLLRSLLLADRSLLSSDVKRNFVNSGVIHVLAVSGLHVGYILLIALFLFGRFNLYFRFFFTILALVVFMFVTGMPASVVRASLMAIFSILSLLLNRDYNLLNSISFAALLILIFNPTDLFSPGFQLSFAAVLSIVYFVPLFKRGVEKIGLRNNLLRKVFLFMTVSLAAQIGTLPFVLVYFKKLSLVSLFANLVVIPLVGIIVSNGILTLAVSFISSWLAGIFALANSLLTLLLYELVTFAGSLSFAYISFPTFRLFSSLLYFTGLLLFLVIIKLNISLTAKISFAFAVVIVFSILIFNTSRRYFSDDGLTVLVPETENVSSVIMSLPDGNKFCMLALPNGNPFAGAEISTVLENTGVTQINSLAIFGNPGNIFTFLNELTKRIHVSNVLLTKDIIRNYGKIFEKYLPGNFLELRDEVVFTGHSHSKRIKMIFPSKNKGFVESDWERRKLLFLLSPNDYEIVKNKTKFFQEKFDLVVAVLYKGRKALKILRKINAVAVVFNEIKGKRHRSRTKLDGNVTKENYFYRTDSDGAQLFFFEGDKFYRINWQTFGKEEIK